MSVNTITNARMNHDNMSFYERDMDSPVEFVNRQSDGSRYCYQYCSQAVIELLNKSRVSKMLNALCLFDFGELGSNNELFLQIRNVKIVKCRGYFPMTKIDCILPQEVNVFMNHYQRAIVAAYAKSLGMTPDEFPEYRIISARSPTIRGCYRLDLKSKWFRGYINGKEVVNEMEIFDTVKENKMANIEIHLGKAKIFKTDDEPEKLVCVPFIRKIDIIG
jgi:hypothetical protein